MQIAKQSGILVENTLVPSQFLHRKVKIDFYLPRNVADASRMSLILINDGQILEELGLSNILEELYSEKTIESVLCVGIHAGAERKIEYGIALQPDYKGRGAKAGSYTSFVLEELIPFIKDAYQVAAFREKAFAGFSLGGLSAMDIVWNHPDEFSKAGIFSGSFWWRSVNQAHKEYHDDKHRIMQQQVRNGLFKPGLKFFFQCGNMDETKDRNHNGVIDSIDDTLDLVKELVNKGYNSLKDIFYMETKDGRHDIATWKKAMPEFLNWGWSK